MSQLSPHFAHSEMVVTSTGLPNDPRPRHWCALQALCSAVLEPWRERIGPIRITSGFRTPAVNVAVGGSSSSQHMLGEAADCIPMDVARTDAWAALVELVEAGLPVDQAIIYTDSNFIHVSHTARHPARRELLVKVGPKGGGHYIPWSSYDGLL